MPQPFSPGQGDRPARRTPRARAAPDADAVHSTPRIRATPGGRPAALVSQGGASRRRRALDRQILALAVPALGALVAEPVFLLIDSAMVGHLGESSLAGLALASTILSTVVGLFVFLAYATTATTARLFGAGNRAGGLRAGIDGIWLAVLLGLGAALLLGGGAPWLVIVMGADSDVASGAVAYLRASAPGLPAMLVVFASTGTLRGLLDTRTPFVVATAGAALNVALNAVLIYGFGMGVAGSGLGTALAQTAMAVALAAPVMRAARGQRVSLAPRRAGLRTSLGAGTPLLVRTLSLRVAILATVWAATAQGATALAAHQVVAAVWGVVAFALDALAIAAQALVGRALGRADARSTSTRDVTAHTPEGDVTGAARAARTPRGADGTAEPGVPSAEGATDESPLEPESDVDAVLRRSLGWGVATGAVIGVVVGVLSPWAPRLFSSEAAVVEAAAPALLVAATAMPLAGAVFLFDGVLMGAGDGRYLARAGIMTLVPYLPLTVVIAQGWAGSGAGSLAWLWVAFGWVFMGARVLTTGLRARSDTWRH